MALKESKGSAQDRQVHRDLQGVEPKRLISRVSAEPQRGQRAARVRATGRPGCAAGPGGAMPNSRSLARPGTVIQSVVQGGDSTVRTRTSAAPDRSRTARASAAMTAVAGQPV